MSLPRKPWRFTQGGPTTPRMSPPRLGPDRRGAVAPGVVRRLGLEEPETARWQLALGGERALTQSVRRGILRPRAGRR